MLQQYQQKRIGVKTKISDYFNYCKNAFIFLAEIIKSMNYAPISAFFKTKAESYSFL